MNNEARTKLESMAEKMYPGLRKFSEEVASDSEALGPMAALRPAISMDDLYESDKAAWMIYQMVLGSQDTVHPERAVLVSVSRVVNELAAEGIVVSGGEVEGVLADLAGTVVAHAFPGGSLEFPMLSIIAVTRYADDAFYLLGPHGKWSSSLLAFPRVAREIYEGVKSYGR